MSYARRHAHSVSPEARVKLNSRSVWNKLYVNFLLRRLNTSYKIKIADLRYGGQLVCRETWTTILRNYREYPVSVIELMVVGTERELVEYKNRRWLPADNVVGRAYCDGSIWLSPDWYRMLYSQSRRAVTYALGAALQHLGSSMYRVITIGISPVTIQMQEGQSFTEFMQQNWRV